MKAKEKAAGGETPAAFMAMDDHSVAMAQRSFCGRLIDRDSLGEGDDLVQSREADQDVDDPRQERILAAEEASDEVELEEAYQKPVDASDDDQQKRNEVKGAHAFFLCVVGVHPTLLYPVSSLRFAPNPIWQRLNNHPGKYAAVAA